jgi:hypothetical protein
MSPVMAPSVARTELCAWAGVQGADAEQSVPLPVGDTKNVVAAAGAAIAAGAGVAVTTRAATAAAATAQRVLMSASFAVRSGAM